MVGIAAKNLEDKAKNCLGNPERDKGQSLLPDPPDNIMGTTIILFKIDSFLDFIYLNSINLALNLKASNPTIHYDFLLFLDCVFPKLFNFL